jgi:photosystem II stability/assembly factor-like uncharacterized protein
MLLARFALVLALVAATSGAAFAQRQPAQPTSRPAAREQRRTTAADTARRDTAQVRDSLTRFIESVAIRHLGPAAYSGRVTAIAVPHSAQPRPSTFYIGSAGGGVWKTTNAGVTWQSASSGLGSETIGDLAVAPSDSNLLWVGTGEKNSLRSAYWGDGVYKSTNGGRAWTKMGLGDSRAIGRVVIHPTDPSIVYVAALGHLWGAGGERGVYKTTDSGTTWSRVLFVNDTTGFVDLEMDPSNPEVLYAAAWHRIRWGGSHMEGVGNGSGIYKSTDAGATWTRLTDPALANGLPTDRMGRIGLAVSPQNPNIVYAMIQVDRGITDQAQTRYGGVFRSSDAGAHWTQVNDIAATPHYFYDEIYVDPSDTNHVFFTSVQMWQSRDGGRTFAPDSAGGVHVDNHAFWIDPNDPAHWILGNDGGAYVSYDRGRAWWHMPLPLGQFYTVMVDSSHTPYQICGGLQDNGAWCGPSRTRESQGISDAEWYPVNGGDGMYVQIPFDDPFTVYSNSQFGSISRLDLRTWQRADIQPEALDAGAESGYAYTWDWMAPIVASAHLPGVVYFGGNRLFKLKDRGRDYEILGPDMTRNARQTPAPEQGSTSYHALFSIAESPRTAAVLWTGSDDGLVWVSQDTGKTWTNTTASFPRGAPTNCFVATIAASYHAEGTAYVALDCHHRDDYAAHVFQTTDFGRTWTEIGQGLPRDHGSLTVFEDNRNPRLLFVGTTDGVWTTVDGGRRWGKLGRNFPSIRVDRLAISFAQRELVIGTHGRGIYIANIIPLEEMTDSLLGEPAHLFGVAQTFQFRRRNTFPSWGANHFLAPNPAVGASFQYWLKDVQPEGVRFTITTAAGDTVRSVTGPGYPGLQRASWDLTRERPRPRGLGDPTSREELQRMPAGEYIIRGTVAGRRMEQRFVVLEWPQDRLGRVR